MDQRKFPRIKTKIAAEVNNRQALLENISRKGIKIKLWSDAVPTTCDMMVTFTVGEQTINLKGEIRWCRREKNSFQDLKEMGLYLEDAPEEYYKFVDALSNRRESAVRI
ncbi:MAG: PilZ domain-containing protein [Candidatus Aminicenantes bacterium]|nr:PilZ domain-containing protein [Candidatus Aminicenantes bacterium]